MVARRALDARRAGRRAAHAAARGAAEPRGQPPRRSTRGARLPPGDVIVAEDVIALRPARGLDARHWQASSSARRACTRHRRRRGASRRRICPTARGSGGHRGALNVLMTAASRRVGAGAGLPARARRPGRLGRSHRHRRQPAVAGRPRRRPRLPGAVLGRPGYLDAILAICRAHDIGLVVPTIDDELPLFARGRDRFTRAGVRVAVSSLGTDHHLQRQARDLRDLHRPGVAAAATWLPEQLPADPRCRSSSSRAAAAAASALPRRRSRQRAGVLPSSYVTDAGGAGVPRRPGVHDRHAVRLRRPSRCRSCRASAS